MSVSFRHLLLAVALLVLTVALAYGPQQSEFPLIIGLYLPLFFAFLLAYSGSKDAATVRFFLITGVVLRAALLFGIPQLSDDIYRFVWDGRLLIAGYNPFDQLPSYYLDQNIPGVDAALFAELNSSEYFTIYPPVAQSVFAIACWLFPKSVWGSAFVMKLFLFAGEVGSLYLLPRLLKKFQLPAKNVLLYALNPLIIIEICGNLHFEGLMIFFLLLAIWYLVQQKYDRSAVMMALSVGSKLLPLLFLPLLIKRLGWAKSIRYFIIVGGSLLLLFAPLLSSVFLSNFSDSLDLYFRRFEFNAGIYYVLRWLGYQVVGYNIIGHLGPALALVVFAGVLYYAWKEKSASWGSLPRSMLFVICFYLFCGTTVHPWYLSLPILLCVFTRFRFPVLWSGLIFLTYINYSYEPYWENLGMVSVEYVLVFGVLWWEWKVKPLGIN